MKNEGRSGKGGGGGGGGLLPNSLRILSSCLKTVSSNATTVASTVCSAGASVAASISPHEDERDQVQWAGFDRLEIGPSMFKHVLLLGYSTGFQVLDVDDASNFQELVSKRDGAVTFLQMQPIPAKTDGEEGFRESHPLLLVVAGDGTFNTVQIHDGSSTHTQQGGNVPNPTVVRFYSLRSHNYVHVLRFRSTVFAIRCSPRIVAVAIAAQIYCFDAVTLENKFSVLTYPITLNGQGVVGVNIGYGPMAVGPSWLAYASNHALTSNTGRLSPQNLSPSPGVSPSTSPGNGSLVARYAKESTKQIAAGIINLGDIGYKTFSKYYQELLPDGSNSPVSSNANWKVNRVVSGSHPSETDNAGMVAVRDFTSKAIIAHFKAHTSPISAISFDPSGTLLVTASVHGNNLNVFRIIPSRVQNSSTTYDWSSSHVHLYKLYRGLTTAVIQDIVFSNYSQWVAIISSRGTCHIFALSPFGGDVGVHSFTARENEFHSLPNLFLPWWSTSGSLSTNQHNFPPPPAPITLATVSRIKNGIGGWLNTVSGVAASATGKAHSPSGAMAAVFHNSIIIGLQSNTSRDNLLENLLVYSPSGHVIQYVLFPSSGTDVSYSNGSRIGPGSLSPNRDEELKVLAEPVQWWDVCRRTSWPEREENISGITHSLPSVNGMPIDNVSYSNDETSSCGLPRNGVIANDSVKCDEKFHVYISNAEVQINSGRIPIWQKSKIRFYLMMPTSADEKFGMNGNYGGEIEIEKIPICEVEIRRKDLLPVFDHFRSFQSDQSGRCPVGGRNSSVSALNAHQTKDKLMEGLVLKNSASHGYSKSVQGILGNPDAYQSVEMPTPVGSSTNSNLMSHDFMKATDRRSIEDHPASPQMLLSTWGSNKDFPTQDFRHCNNQALETIKDATRNGFSLTSCDSLGFERPDTKVFFLSNGVTSNCVDNKNIISNASTLKSQTIQACDNGDLNGAMDFQEGYCKISEVVDCHESAEIVADANSSSSSSSHREKEKPGEDGDHDNDPIEGVFTFCDEGYSWKPF
ncbi:hypothetical protein AMTRI_Chr12g275510 [Amborella trichopoda]